MGCDALMSCGAAKHEAFQSTHPHGVRHDAALALCQRQGVSIHAPTWGATACVHAVPPRCRCFNPRTHMGCDYMRSITLASVAVFQSTHPHGVRPEKCSIFAASIRFQSTHPHGVRLIKFVRIKHLIYVSIHAPTWGATWSCFFALS